MSREDRNADKRVFLLLKGDSMEGICILWWALTNFHQEKIKLVIIFIIPPNGSVLPALTQSINETLKDRNPKRTKKSALKQKAEIITSTNDDFENGVLELISLYQIKRLAVTSVFTEKLANANDSCKIWFVWYGKVVFIRDKDESRIIMMDEPSTSSRLSFTSSSLQKWFSLKHRSSKELENLLLRNENEDLKQDMRLLRNEIDMLVTENKFLKFQHEENITNLEEKNKEKTELEFILATTINRLEKFQSNFKSNQRDYIKEIERLGNENEGFNKENRLLKSQQEENSNKIRYLIEQNSSTELKLETGKNQIGSLELNNNKMQEDLDNANKEVEELKHEIKGLQSEINHY